MTSHAIPARGVSAARLSSPAALRNAGPIADAVRDVLPAAGLVLEIASGTGEHALHLARTYPDLAMQPSDPSAAARASITAWAADAALPNLLPAIALDAVRDDWPVGCPDAILCINMVHIAPWDATQGLMRGAARLLASGAPLILYGPFLRDGVATAPGNAAFDADLRRRDAGWGLRRLEAVAALGDVAGLALDTITAMPANNLMLTFRRR